MILILSCGLILAISMCKELQPFIPYYVNDEDGKKNSKHVGVYVGYSPVENSAVIVFRGSDFLINFIQVLNKFVLPPTDG
jgi:hypothetical protein